MLRVPRKVVAGLVDAFLDSRLGRSGSYCSRFSPDGLRVALAHLPDAAEGWVDYHAASRVISEYECDKMTGNCNTWTPWMRHRLNAAKVKV